MSTVKYTKRLTLDGPDKFNYEIIEVELEADEGKEEERMLEARKIVGMTTTKYLTKNRGTK